MWTKPTSQDMAWNDAELTGSTFLERNFGLCVFIEKIPDNGGSTKKNYVLQRWKPCGGADGRLEMMTCLCPQQLCHSPRVHHTIWHASIDIVQSDADCSQILIRPTSCSATCDKRIRYLLSHTSKGAFGQECDISVLYTCALKYSSCVHIRAVNFHTTPTMFFAYSWNIHLPMYRIRL